MVVVAAVYWIWSACVELPVAPDAVLVQTAPDDPFNVALRHATELNAYAAVWTGVSVLLAAVER
jgi:hypothetical protein